MDRLSSLILAHFSLFTRRIIYRGVKQQFLEKEKNYDLSNVSDPINLSVHCLTKFPGACFFLLGYQKTSKSQTNINGQLACGCWGFHNAKCHEIGYSGF